MNEISVHFMFTLLKHYINLVFMLQNGRLGLGLDSNFIEIRVYMLELYIFVRNVCVCRKSTRFVFFKVYKS